MLVDRLAEYKSFMPAGLFHRNSTEGIAQQKEEALPIGPVQGPACSSQPYLLSCAPLTGLVSRVDQSDTAGKRSQDKGVEVN